MFGSKKCLVSVLLVWVVVTVVEGVPVTNDEPTKPPTLKRQKRTFFSSWWPYSYTEETAPQVQPYYRITIRGQTHSAVVDDWNNQHAAAVIAELEAAQKRLEETLYKLKNLSIKKLYNSDESYEEESGETATRPPLKPYNIKYVPVKTTPPVVRTTTVPPQVEPHPTPATPTSTKIDSEPVIVNPANNANSQKVDSATSTPSIDIRVKPDEDVKTTTTSATVQVTPEERTKVTTPAAVEVRPVEPVTTTPAAVEVRPVETVTTAPAAVEVRPVQPTTTTTPNENTNDKVEPEQQVTTPETKDDKIQPDQPATTTTDEVPVNRIRPPTTSTVSDENADVKIEPQQQSTTVSTDTVDDSDNAAIDNVQPEQPTTEDSSDTIDPEPSVEPRYAAESASLENWKNNKKKISWDYYLKKRVPVNEKMSSKIAAQYARELQADR